MLSFFIGCGVGFVFGFVIIIVVGITMALGENKKDDYVN